MVHMLHLIELLLLHSTIFTLCVRGCYPQFEKELRYLDLYLGIRPDDNGQIPQKEPSFFASYISSSVDLDCDFEGDCLWKNADSDGLLDTSDWWFFEKSDDKIFPVQIQPGNPEIRQGSHLLVAGNTTTAPESAVLLSSPIACQRGIGNLTFNYWLYNHAKIEVIIVRLTNRRRHLQALSRPYMNCHFLRPGNDICQVTLPSTKEPFRIAIRAFNLKDNIVGSMAIINNITYRAETCGESPFPSIFSSISLDTPSAKPVETISELNCDHPRQKCRWSNAESTVSEWRVGRSVERWQELMEVSAMESKPNSSFLFLVIDSLSPRPYATLRSELIPCTQRATTLSLKYWLKAGTQVEVCSVDEYGVPLSCAYLVEEDSPGPIEIDVDAYDKPFRFTLEIIAFDETAIGLVAVADIHLSGLLCSEDPPPVLTTIDPPTIISLFGLQRGPGANVPYPLTLDCDFSQDYCSQWVNDDGRIAYGVAPRKNDKFPMPKEIKGNVATFILPGKTSSILRSREVPCAHDAILMVTYLRSEYGSVHLCVLNKCVEGTKPSGIVSVQASSLDPFEFTIEASSHRNSVVVISNITVIGDICPLKTVEQIVCEKLKCAFQDGLCHYQSPVDKPGDVPLVWTSKGLTATLDGERHRAVLSSPRFDLPAASLLIISLTQKTYGSRVLLCPDEMSDSESCHELLGPRVIASALHRISFPLDAGAHRFVLILYHDKAEQFGPALFDLHSIDIRTSHDYQLCF